MMKRFANMMMMQMYMVSMCMFRRAFGHLSCICSVA